MAVCRMFVYTILVALLVDQIAVSNGHQCYRQRCLDCGDLSTIGDAVDCSLDNIVSLEWLVPGNIPPAIGTVPANTQYSCAKIHSKDARGQTHQIRGCLPGNAEVAKTLCDVMTTVHQTMTERQAECHVCGGNLCNSALANGPVVSLLGMVAIFRVAKAFL